MEASSPGRVQPKIKSINLEANLLAERISERERLLDALSRRALAGISVLVFGALVLPASYKVQARMADRAIAATKTQAEAEARVTARKAVLAALLPKVQDSEMLSLLRTYSGNFTNQLTSFTNSANARMVFSSLKCEVMGGEMKIFAKADAESYAAAREFVDVVNKLPRTKSAVLKGWRQNEQFAPDGVSLEVDRIAEVSK